MSETPEDAMTAAMVEASRWADRKFQDTERVRKAIRRVVLAELNAPPCYDDDSEVPRGTIICGEPYDGRIAHCSIHARIAELEAS